MADRPQQSEPYLFVSYASVDRDRVLAVVDAVRQAGVPVWLDQHDIEGGANYAFEITEAIEHSAAFALMCTPASLASRNVRQEIALAWKFARPYLPLLLEPVTIPKEVAYWLEAAQWIEILEKPRAEWLPAILTALVPLGIAPERAEGTTLAGREREQEILRDRLADAIGKRGSLVLIGGEAGIGKTTLAEALCREAAARGAFVVVGRCFDLAETPPYGPWIEAFRRYEPTAGLPPVPAAFAQRGTVGAVSSQSALFEQIHDFFAALTTARPAVLLLDDYHWADAASLDLLRFVARDCAALPLLVLVTYRSDELTRRHPLYTLLPTLVRESSAARLDLRPLDDAAVRTLIIQRYGLDETDVARLTAYLQERAEGNGLFLTELLRTLEEQAILRETAEGWQVSDLRQVSIPALLRQVIDGRVARLGEEAQRLLAMAAIIGHEVPLDVWATVAQGDEEEMLTLIERAAEAQVLDESADGTTVRFSHALIRETLVAGVSASRRRTMQRRVGEVLAAVPNADPDTVAYHFQQAGDARAAEWLLRAGERAQLAYAWLTATERYDAALALLDAGGGDSGERGWLRYRIARLRRYSTPEQSIEYLDEVLDIADAVGDRALAAAARYTRGLCLHYCATDQNAALRELAAGCDALESLPADKQARLDLEPDARGIPTITNPRGMLVAALAANGPIAEAMTMGEATHEGKPRHTPLGELGWAHYGDRHVGLGIAYALAGRPTEARASFDRARACFGEVGNYATIGGTATFDLLLVSLAYYADRPEEREHLAEEAAAARRLSSTTSGNYARLAHLPVLALAARWHEAREGAEEARRRTRWQQGWRDIATAVLVVIAHGQGETEESWSHIRSLLPSGSQAAPGTMPWYIGLPMMRCATMLSMDTGDLATAKEWLEAHDRWLAWSGAVLGLSEGQALWGAYYRAAGDATAAYTHAERALAHATEPRQPLALIAARRLLGELDTEGGRFDSARTHLDASLALADACAAPYERALTLLAMAALHAATGDVIGARTLLDEVRAICTPLGAQPALARAATLAANLTA